MKHLAAEATIDSGVRPLVLINFRENDKTRTVAGHVKGLSDGSIVLKDVLSKKEAKAFKWCYRQSTTHNNDEPTVAATGQVESSGDDEDQANQSQNALYKDQWVPITIRKFFHQVRTAESGAWPENFCNEDQFHDDHTTFLFFMNVDVSSLLELLTSTYVDPDGDCKFKVPIDSINCCAGGNG